MFPSNCKISYPTNFNVEKKKHKKIKTYFWTGGNINPVYNSEKKPEAKPLKVIRLSTLIKNMVNPVTSNNSDAYYGEDIKGSHNHINEVLAAKLESLSSKNDEINKYLAEIERLKQEAANKNNNNSEGLTPTNNPTPEPEGEPK